MNVNFYYSDDLTSDTEGNLVQLCRECAKTNRDKATWASRGDDQSICELCEACNDPTWVTYRAPKGGGL
jgi:hypothetical protein